MNSRFQELRPGENTMDISKVSIYTTGNVSEPKSTTTAKANGEDKAASGTSGVSSDQVKLSKDYQELVAKRASMSQDDIRTEKVAQISAQLQSGTYQIEPEKIAGKMLDEVI